MPTAAERPISRVVPGERRKREPSRWFSGWAMRMMSASVSSWESAINPRSREAPSNVCVIPISWIGERSMSAVSESPRDWRRLRESERCRSSIEFTPGREAPEVRSGCKKAYHPVLKASNKRFWSSISQPLLPRHHRLQDMAGDLGVLAQAADRGGVPVVAVGDVDAHPVAGGDEDAAQLLVDPQEHLELVLVRLQPVAVDQRGGGGGEKLVVGGDADVSAAREELVEGLDVVVPDGVVPLPGDGARLDVDPLAEAHAGPLRRQLLDVAQGAAHVGL